MANLIYFNARAKALEAGLLNYAKLTALVKCTSLFEVTKLLNDWKILKGITIQNYSDLILLVEREEKDFLQFLKQTAPDKTICKFFLLKRDYFNMQVFYLNKQLNKNIKPIAEGQFLHSTLEKAVESGNYELLSANMKKCLQFADEQFKNKTQTGFVIDTAFKKSMYDEMLQTAQKSKELFKYMNFYVDIKNIELALRFRDEGLFEKIRLNGGTLDSKFLKDLNSMSFEQILIRTKQSTYYSAIELIINDLLLDTPLDRFELMVDCFGQTYFDRFKYQTTGQVPYIRYCFLKQSELLNLRIIFEGLNANRPKKKIINELRRVYAE